MASSSTNPIQKDQEKTGIILTPEDYLNNEEWVKRIEVYFKVLDRDKNGVLTVNDFVFDAKKYAHLHPDPKVLENFRLAQIEFSAELGVKPGIVVTKEEFVKNFATMAPVEVAKNGRGEDTWLHKMLNKTFDLIDSTHDGTVAIEKYRELAIASEFWNPDFIDIQYELMDTDKTGKLERSAIIDFQYRMTFTLGDIEGKGQFFDTLKPVCP